MKSNYTLGSAIVGFLLTLTVAGASQSPVSPKVPDTVRAALKAYLLADEKGADAALRKVVSSCGGKLDVAYEAIRSAPPLAVAKPGIHHGLKFRSRGIEWEYSVRLPKAYDGKNKYPVLVLPDHGAVSAEDGMGFWDSSPEAEEMIIFRPVVMKHETDRARFSDQQFFAKMQSVAAVFGDALTHIRLHYATDPDRFVATGLSQAGYATWLLGVNFPDQFAGIVPESAGGQAVLAGALGLAKNLEHVAVRILHCEADTITPYKNAQQMEEAIKNAGGKVELLTFKESDWGGSAPSAMHPTPHALRAKNVLPWALVQKRKLPREFTRVMRYQPQGFEGRFRLKPPRDVAQLYTAFCKDGASEVTCDAKEANYLVDPRDLLAKRTIKVGKSTVTPKVDLELLFRTFRQLGDPERVAAAEIEITR